MLVFNPIFNMDPNLGARTLGPILAILGSSWGRLIRANAPTHCTPQCDCTFRANAPKRCNTPWLAHFAIQHCKHRVVAPAMPMLQYLVSTHCVCTVVYSSVSSTWTLTWTPTWGPTWGHPGAVLGPDWGNLGSTWAQLGHMLGPQSLCIASVLPQDCLCLPLHAPCLHWFKSAAHQAIKAQLGAFGVWSGCGPIRLFLVLWGTQCWRSECGPFRLPLLAHGV